MAKAVSPHHPVVSLDTSSLLDARQCTPVSSPLIKEPAIADISGGISPNQHLVPRELASPEPLSINQTLPFGDAAMSPVATTTNSDVSLTSQALTEAYNTAINSLVSQGHDLPGISSLQAVSSSYQLVSGSTVQSSSLAALQTVNSQNLQPMNLSAMPSSMSQLTQSSTAVTSPTSKSPVKGKNVSQILLYNI